jgi:hypothetical protein
LSIWNKPSPLEARIQERTVRHLTLWLATLTLALLLACPVSASAKYYHNDKVLEVDMKGKWIQVEHSKPNGVTMKVKVFIEPSAVLIIGGIRRTDLNSEDIRSMIHEGDTISLEGVHYRRGEALCRTSVTLEAKKGEPTKPPYEDGDDEIE